MLIILDNYCDNRDNFSYDNRLKTFQYRPSLKITQYLHGHFGAQ